MLRLKNYNRKARATQGGMLRKAEVCRDKVDKDKRTFEIALSSEFPVDRGYYTEVLSHEADNVDLSRINDKHPFLVNHNVDDQVGVVEKAWLDSDRKLRATVRLGTSQRAEEIWQDIVNGIRPHISVGYEHTKELASVMRNGKEFVTFAWLPYEASTVPIPADPTAGVGRNKPGKAGRHYSADMYCDRCGRYMEMEDSHHSTPDGIMCDDCVGKKGKKSAGDPANKREWGGLCGACGAVFELDKEDADDDGNPTCPECGSVSITEGDFVHSLLKGMGATRVLRAVADLLKGRRKTAATRAKQCAHCAAYVKRTDPFIEKMEEVLHFDLDNDHEAGEPADHKQAVEGEHSSPTGGGDDEDLSPKGEQAAGMPGAGERTCTSCGHSLDHDATSCAHCGTAVAARDGDATAEDGADGIMAKDTACPDCGTRTETFSLSKACPHCGRALCVTGSAT